MATVKKTEVMSPEQRLKEELLRQQEQAAGVQTGGNFITFKNGNMKVNGIPVPNNQAEVRVLAIVAERAWYDAPYNPDKPAVPRCYSLGTTGKPHPEAEAPQWKDCETCPFNQWGSGTNGKGKACKQGARVVVVPTNLDLITAPLYMAKIPVTSLKNINGFAARCNQMNKPYGLFTTILRTEEDKKSFFKVYLDVKEMTAGLDMQVLLDKQDAAYKMAMAPYPSLGE